MEVMKVAVIPTITAYPWGAPGHCMGTLVEELLDSGHEVQWFVAPIDLRHPEVQRLGKRCRLVTPLPTEPPRYLRWRRTREKLWMASTRYRSLASEVDAFAPEHVFFNLGGTWFGPESLFAEMLRGQNRNYSLICHLNYERGSVPESEQRYARALLAGAKFVFVNSAYMLQLTELQLAADISNARHYHYPHRFAFEGALAWPVKEQASLAFVGRLDKFHKGLDLALCALKELKGQGAEFRFTLYGDGPDCDYLGQLTRHLGLGSEVVFAGYADSVEKVWAENEILFMPSRHEGCAVAMTEAIGFGRPVVATAVGGASEWIEDSVTGFLAAAPTVALVAEALRRAVLKRDSWRQMGEAAHQKFKVTMPERPARVFLEALRP